MTYWLYDGARPGGFDFRTHGWFFPYLADSSPNCRRYVEILWQLEHRSSHFPISASVRSLFLIMVAARDTGNNFSTPGRWSQSNAGKFSLVQSSPQSVQETPIFC